MNLFTLTEDKCIEALPVSCEAVVKVLRVIDGDTIKIGFFCDGIAQKISVRCVGYNAPEMNSRDPVEKTYALESKLKLQQLCEGKLITLKTVTPDKYGGRVLADASCGDEVPSICDYMLQFPNLARIYTGHKKKEWKFEDPPNWQEQMLTKLFPRKK